MLRIFFKMKEQYIKTEMEYRFNFWMMLIAGVVMKLAALAVPFVLYSSILDIAGWRREEIYLIMAYLFIAEGLCSVLFQGIWEMPEMVFGGRFDCILSRPVSPLFQVLSYGMGLQGISVFLFGLTAMVWLQVTMGIFCIRTILLSLFFIVCGTALCMSVYLLGNSVVFWYDSGGRTTIPYMVSSIGQYARYPVEIYSKAVRLVLMFVIPYAFICVVPVQILRGEHMAPQMLALAAVTVLFLIIARTVFYRGLRHYESMGM